MDNVTARYQQELKHTRQVVRNRVEEHWRALPDYRDHQIKPFLEKVLPVVRAGQERAVALTDAYMSHKAGLQKPVGLSVDKLVGAAVRNGVEPAEVYQRPFVTVWSSIEKIGIALAATKALNRLLSTADMDVAMSARDASVAFGQVSDSRTIGWTRVADPSCCDFCQSIDGARIYVDDPAPLHNNCGCTVEPIIGSGDSGPISREDFDNIAPGAVFDDAKIEEHGELGPVITDKHDEFTSVHDLPASYEKQVNP